MNIFKQSLPSVSSGVTSVLVTSVLSNNHGKNFSKSVYKSFREREKEISWCGLTRLCKGASRFEFDGKKFPLVFCQIQNGIPGFILELMTILVLIDAVFVIIWEMFLWRISLNLVPLLLLVNFMGVFRLESIYVIFLIGNIESRLTHVRRFQLLVVLP